MRAYITRPMTSRRIAAGFAAALLAAIAMVNTIPLHAGGTELPGPTPVGLVYYDMDFDQYELPGPIPVELVYFDAVPMGFDQWFVDGAVDASDMSSVTITFGGAASTIGTVSPDDYGYFNFEISATAYDQVTANATDGFTNSSRCVTLEDWF